MATSSPIFFRGSDCVLSNFYEFDFEYMNMNFKSVEHCYQYIKSDIHGDLDLSYFIRNAETASAAKYLSKTIRPNKFWFHYKFELMSKLCDAKFQQCSLFSDYLMSTKNSVLYHNVPDDYWGTGTYDKIPGKGQNVFGRLLMKLREKNSSMKIAIFGSSYVTRLETFCDGQFDSVPGIIKFFGKGGMRADNIPTDLLNGVVDFKPNYVFVHLGGNDIGINKKVQEIVNDLDNLVTIFKTSGVEDVFIGEIIPRGDFSKSPGMDFETFKKLRSSINRKLFKKYGKRVIHFINLKYPRDYDDHLVHLNVKGMKTYFHKLRRLFCGLKC